VKFLQNVDKSLLFKISKLPHNAFTRYKNTQLLLLMTEMEPG